MGSKFRNLKILNFLASTSKFYNKSRTPFLIFSPNTKNSLSVSICKKNEVNWAKNDLVRAVFVDEVKIHDFAEILISVGRIDPIFSLLPNNCLS